MALAWRNFAAELRNIGFTCSQNGSRAGIHLCRRTGRREKQDGCTGNQNFHVLPLAKKEIGLTASPAGVWGPEDATWELDFNSSVAKFECRSTAASIF